MSIKAIEKALSKKSVAKIKVREMLSSGSTLLNLASTGRTKGFFLKGHYYWFVGDSTSGKTWLAHAAMAEAAMNDTFADYRLIYDNSENGALMDIKRYFGAAVADRIEPPHGTKDNPVYSELVENFYDYISEAVEEGSPFVYVLDSMDVLQAKEDKVKADKDRGRRLAGKADGAGTYGMAKAKLNSTNLRDVVSGLRKTGSILIIISQTRDRTGFAAKFDPKTVAGGRSLKFYATIEIWTAVKNKIKKLVRKKQRAVGIISKVRLKKNRVTGRDRTIEVPIYYSHGIDDVGSCVDFLIEEGHWKVSKGVVKAPELDFEGDKEELIQHIESENLESELRSITGEVYREIEKECEVKRKPRYQ